MVENKTLITSTKSHRLNIPPMKKVNTSLRSFGKITKGQIQ